MPNPSVDRMVLTILEDGTARLEVDGISGTNHVLAEELVEQFARLMGGPLNVHTRPQKMSHQHHHGHEHQHEKGGK